MDSFQVSLPKCGTYGIQTVQEGSLESQRVLFVKEILLGSKPRNRWIFLFLNAVLIGSSCAFLSDLTVTLNGYSGITETIDNYFSSVCPGSDFFHIKLCFVIYSIFVGWNILMFFIDLWEPKALEISTFIQGLIFIACAYCSLRTDLKCRDYYPRPCADNTGNICGYYYPPDSSKVHFLGLLGISFFSFILSYNWEVLKEQAVRNKKTVDLILAAEQL